SGDDDSATHPEEEEQQEDVAVPLGAGKQEEGSGDGAESEDEASLVALGVEQRTDAQRRNDEAERLHGGDGAVLGRREVKTLRELRQDGAEHGGDHSVDEDGKDGSEDEHGTGFLSSS